jgi:hypothetical protein
MKIIKNLFFKLLDSVKTSLITKKNIILFHETLIVLKVIVVLFPVIIGTWFFFSLHASFTLVSGMPDLVFDTGNMLADLTPFYRYNCDHPYIHGWPEYFLGGYPVYTIPEPIPKPAFYEQAPFWIFVMCVTYVCYVLLTGSF